MATVLIADEYAVVREGVRTIVETHEGWHVVAEAADGAAAVTAAAATHAGIAVIDLSLPVLDGLQATRRIRAQSPHTRVLIFTGRDTDWAIRDALRAGAHGYVLKSDGNADLAAALDALANGRSYLSAGAIEWLVASVRDDAAGAVPQPPLTAREREIVQFVANGHTSKRIGLQLGLSVKTVEAHRANAMRKLGLASTAGLVRYAIRNRLVEA